MADDSGQTIGVWIGASDDVLDRFDETLECGPNHAGSRSEEIKEAMRLAIAVHETVEDFPYDPSGPALRHQTQQALIDKDRREAARHGGE
jgi:hypothetical protein